MSSIRFNQATRLTVNYVSEGTVNQLILNPGVNIAVEDSEWAVAARHPVVETFIQQGIIEVMLRTPEPKHDIGGIPVVDSKVTDEPMPVTTTKLAKKPLISDVVK